MANPRDVLVVTTNTVEGLEIKRYLKPVSAHVVAGTNIFSDLLGGLTDIFGGRSRTYQRQLKSLYNEAIEWIKYAACEVGANCVVGLAIDMDEISGKGKAMFMLTAVGTAVVLEEKQPDRKMNLQQDQKPEIVAAESITALRYKKDIIGNAEAGNLKIDEGIWDFITAHQVDEVFPYLLRKYQDVINYERHYPESGSIDKFHKRFIGYIDALPDGKKLNLLYDGVAEQNDEIADRLSETIKELHLFDFNRVMELLKEENFQVQKRGVQIATYDKPFYNHQDVHELREIQNFIQNFFTERGTRTLKKQLLSSVEKEVWNCECGKLNDIYSFCKNCGEDIYGFKENEVDPVTASEYLEQKIGLITEYIK